jgi:hypothetical protein
VSGEPYRYIVEGGYFLRDMTEDEASDEQAVEAALARFEDDDE